MDQKLIKININIAGRSYPLKVTQDEEQQAREIEKKINTNIMQTQQNYPNMDIIDCLNMNLIQLAFEQNDSIPPHLIEKANAIKEILDSVD